ncbi:hypothetical protein [Geminisphaera colitermitum]|uniref:hypothetical protein n=1 Tax=Geminisphaera colitermitum TaxID=1148786 RepID=UPI000158C98A|nr:hypothetical protein [Geminisphaera colitermitum]
MPNPPTRTKPTKKAPKPAVVLKEVGPCGFIPLFTISDRRAHSLPELFSAMVSIENALNSQGWQVHGLQIRPVGRALPITGEVAAQIPKPGEASPTPGEI